MTTRPPVQLVPDEHASHELVVVLDGLLDAAKGGALTGLIFGASFKGQRYMCDAAGSLHRNPIVALGLSQMLVAEMSQYVRREAGATR